MHKARIYDFSQDFKIVQCVVGAVRIPWNRSSRGRPYETEPEEYAKLIVFMVSKDFSLRYADGISALLIGKRVPKSNIEWAMSKLPEKYVRKLAKLVNWLIDCKGMKYVFIGDSTGIETTESEMVIHKARRKLRKKHIKWHIITKYFYEFGFQSIVNSCVTGGYAHDSPAFRSIVDEDFRDGWAFLDSAYECEANHELCAKHRVKLISKAKRGLKFDYPIYEILYQEFRGVIEGVFGTNSNVQGNKTRFRTDHNKRIHVLLLSVCRNLSTYKTSIEAKKKYIKSVLLAIYWTASLKSEGTRRVMPPALIFS